MARLWNQAQPKVAAYIFSAITDFHHAEDIVQQVAVAIAMKFDTYDKTRSFIAWSMGIARNKILQYYTKHAAEMPLLDAQTLATISLTYEHMEPELDAMKSALETCVGQLQARGRQALQLRYTENIKPQQIAREMAMTPTAVRTLLHRVRESLRQCIQKRLAAEKRL